VKNRSILAHLTRWHQFQDSYYVHLGTRYQNVLTGSFGTAGPWANNYRNLASDPNWKTKVSFGQDASLPYSVKVTDVYPCMIKLEAHARVPGFDIMEYNTMRLIPDYAIYEGYTDTTTQDQALTRLKRKLNNRTESFKSLVPLAEIRDLRSLVNGMSGITTKVVGALRDVKKGRFKDSYKKASDIWLTYSFGVRPIMKDISDLGNSISAFLTRQNHVDRLTGSASRSWNESFKSTGTTAVNSSSVARDIEVASTISYKYICAHKFLLESANNYTAADHFGLSPRQLIPTAWEATAFSWIFDYFSTVGEFLDDTFSGTTGQSIYIILNRRYQVLVKAYCYHYKHPGWLENNYLSETTGTARSETYEFSRSPLSAFPPRVLRFRTLDEMGLNGVNKLLNLVSVYARFTG